MRSPCGQSVIVGYTMFDIAGEHRAGPRFRAGVVLWLVLAE